jgi:hypothetical protein
MTAPSGNCELGYTCPEGSVLPALKTLKCPENTYCIDGVQIECPAGSYNKYTGASAETECITCPPGKICPNHFTGITDCTGGKICYANRMSNISQASECLEGFYCPTGTFIPKKCDIGYYNPSKDQITCQACANGKKCETIGLIAETACGTNKICPAMSIRDWDCPNGQQADNSTTCRDCDAGYYCWAKGTVGNNGRVAACDQGYVCQIGSKSPKPYYNIDNLTSGESAFTTYNGPAFYGHKSTDGKTNVPCLFG